MLPPIQIQGSRSAPSAWTVAEAVTSPLSGQGGLVPTPLVPRSCFRISLYSSPQVAPGCLCFPVIETVVTTPKILSTSPSILTKPPVSIVFSDAWAYSPTPLFFKNACHALDSFSLLSSSGSGDLCPLRLLI